MSPLRVLPLLVPLSWGCNLFVSLDPLQRGGDGGEGGGGASSGTLSGGPGSSGTSGGGAGQGGAGGEEPTSWERCVTSKSPRIHLRMSGTITEPNLGSSTTSPASPVGTYFPPHATVASLIDGDADGAASFDDPLTEIGAPTENETGRLELDDPGDLDGYGEFTLELWFRTPETFDAGPLVERTTSTRGFRLELTPRMVSDGLDQVSFFFFDDTHAGSYDQRRRQMIRNVDLSAPGEIHHVVVLHERSPSTSFDQAGNGDDVRIWFDGTPPTTKACCGSALLPAIDAPLRIGNGYSGAIDEVVVYERLLTPAEIQTHHAVGRDGSLSCD